MPKHSLFFQAGLTVGFASLLCIAAPTSAQRNADICLPAWLEAAPGGGRTSDTFSVVRGPDGYVYFGDREGLHRSEGSRLRSWYPDPSSAMALPAGRVRALAVLEETVLLGTARGLVRFAPQTENFDAVPFQEAGLPVSAVLSLLVHEARLYIGHRDGLTVLDAESLAIIGQIKTGGSGASAAVFKIEPFRDGVVAMAMDRHVFIGADLVARPLQRSDGSSIEGGHYTAAQGPDGDLWMSTGSELLRIPLAPNGRVTAWPDFTSSNAIQGSIRHLDFDPEGRLWIGTDYDYARWDIANGAAAPVQCRRASASSDDKPLDARLLSWALGDYLVLGSTGRQPLIARATPWAQRVVLDPRYMPGIAESAPWSARIDRSGRLTLNTNQGLYRERAPGSREFAEVAPNVIQRAQVLTSVEDRRGRLWLGSLAGLFVVEGETARKIPLVRNERGVAGGGAVLSLVQSRDSMIVASDNGLVVLDADKLEVLRYFSNDEGYTAINDAPVVTLDDSRTLHVSVSGDNAIVTGAQALHRINLQTRAVVRSVYAEKDFAAGRIYGTAIAPDGTVYVGTANGIAVTDLELSSFEYRTRVDGTRLGVVSALAIAPDGALWHNSNAGIWRIDPGSVLTRLFTADDGLHAAGSNQNGIAIQDDGRVLIANPAGVTILDPATVPEVDLPQAAVSSYRIDGLSTPFVGEEINVPAGSQGLAVSFGAKAIRLRSDLQFEYRFGAVGELGPGVLISASDPVDFAALPAGRYQLDVRSTLVGGRASDWTTAYIEIAPEWWETVWARAAFLLAGLGIVLAVLYWRASRSRRRQRLVADERSRIAQDLHDTFLQEVLGALMVGRGIASATSIDTMQASANQMVELLDKAAQSARASFNTLTNSNTKQSLVESLQSHDPQALYGNAPAINVVEHGSPWPLGWQRTFFISRIAKEAINNACKHGRASGVSVIVNWHRLSVTVAIIDDGKGFDTSSKHKANGFGMNAMHRLATAGRAKLTIESEPGAGTRVVIEANRIAF